MSYNYNQLFQNGKQSSQNSIYHQNQLRQDSSSIRYNSNAPNHNSEAYVKYIPVANSNGNGNLNFNLKSDLIDYNTQNNLNRTSKNRYSMFNYEFLPDRQYNQTLSRKSSLDTKAYHTDNKRFTPVSTSGLGETRYTSNSFGVLSPKVISNQPKRPNHNFISLSNKKAYTHLNSNNSSYNPKTTLRSSSNVHNFSTNKSNLSDYSNVSDSSSAGSDLDPDINRLKKSPTISNRHLPIYNVKSNSVYNKSERNVDESLPVLIKQQAEIKDNYDNHHYVYNHNLYQKVQDPVGVKDSVNVHGPAGDLKYTKFTYYNRVEENYSSNESVNKLSTNLETLKTFFNKNKRSSSLYYDSGIGADVSLVNSIKVQQYDTGNNKGSEVFSKILTKLKLLTQEWFVISNRI